MTARLLPDSEALALEAARCYMAKLYGAEWKAKGHEVTFVVEMPTDWHSRGPFVMIRRSSGTARDSRVLDSGVFTVHTFAGSRRDASRLARQVRQCLYMAALERFHNEEGALTYFKEVTGPLYSSGDTQLDHPDVNRFVASYILYSHPL
ncbi:hypothetical protein ABZV77_11570 [Streptomyces sp. NPDC004732]|uniref:phage tail termination protein n=1 Tax=Streptomyces sp. NPDC004732 TaxID=3154290 RepID=UPI0033AC94F1